MSIYIGSLRVDSPVLLAPMSGVSDLPFRKLVKEWGAGLVVSEMIASQAMVGLTGKRLKWPPIVGRAADGGTTCRL